jgi:hypothetical protein
LTCSGQLGPFARHSGSHPSKPTGSYFVTPDTGAYDIGARQFGVSGWAGFEAGGMIVLLAPFPAPFAIVEYHGTGAHLTMTGKLVLPHLPAHRHYFGIAHIDGPAPVCSGCGRTWP